MSENKHTPEPWAIDPDDRPNMHWNNHIVSEANPNIAICFMAHDGTEQNERGEANARRVVACVNACAGIDTELLEIIADNDKTLAGVIANVEKQRDELLAALEHFATWARCQHRAQSKGCHATFDMMMLRDEIDFAEAAIASAKELK